MILFQFLPEKNWLMQPQTEYLKILPVLLLLVLMGGCLDNRAARFLWPDLDDPYVSVTREWTRSGSLYSGFETEIIAQATLKSRQWQQAYIQKRSEVYSLTEKEREDLSARLEDSFQRETEILLSLYSPITEQARIRFNDPLWSIFIQDQDKKIYPLEIRPLKQPLAKTSTFYPHIRQWSQNYILRFPLPARDSLTLIMTGPLGVIELNW
jgi:hypothetical protein